MLTKTKGVARGGLRGLGLPMKAVYFPYVIFAVC